MHLDVRIGDDDAARCLLHSPAELTGPTAGVAELQAVTCARFRLWIRWGGRESSRLRELWDALRRSTDG